MSNYLFQILHHYLDLAEQHGQTSKLHFLKLHSRICSFTKYSLSIISTKHWTRPWGYVVYVSYSLGVYNPGSTMCKLIFMLLCINLSASHSLYDVNHSAIYTILTMGKIKSQYIWSVLDQFWAKNVSLWW